MHSLVALIIFFCFDFQSFEQSINGHFIFRFEKIISSLLIFLFMHITTFSETLEKIKSKSINRLSSKLLKLIYSKL